MTEYIDRQMAIEAVKHAWAKGLEPSQYIEEIPAADVAPAPKWISAKDRLPEGDDNEYFVVDENEEIWIASFNPEEGENGEFGFWHETIDPSSLGVIDCEWDGLAEPAIYWMPIPKLLEVE